MTKIIYFVKAQNIKSFSNEPLTQIALIYYVEIMVLLSITASQNSQIKYFLMGWREREERLDLSDIKVTFICSEIYIRPLLLSQQTFN